MAIGEQLELSGYYESVAESAENLAIMEAIDKIYTARESQDSNRTRETRITGSISSYEKNGNRGSISKTKPKPG